MERYVGVEGIRSQKGRTFLKKNAKRYGGGNEGCRRDKVTVTCGKNASEEIEATTDGIIQFPELRREGQYA